MDRFEQVTRLVCFTLEQAGVGLTFALMAFAALDGQPALARGALGIAAVFGLGWSGLMRTLRQTDASLLDSPGPQPVPGALCCAAPALLLSLLAMGCNPLIGRSWQLVMQTAILILGGLSLLHLAAPVTHFAPETESAQAQ